MLAMLREMIFGIYRDIWTSAHEHQIANQPARRVDHGEGVRPLMLQSQNTTSDKASNCFFWKCPGLSIR
jgi:hypothetical protein